MKILAFPKLPEPQACHACDARYVGAICPICKAERPALGLLRAMSGRRERSVGALPKCRYFQNALCNCSLRGLCLPAA